MNMTTSKLRIRSIIIAIVSLFGCTMCLYLVILAILPIYGMFGNGCPTIFPMRIEQEARFRLPSTARNLQSFCMGMQGWIAGASFEIDPTDLEVLIESTAILMPLSTTGAPESWLSSDGMNIETYLYGESEYAWQRILIDTTRSDVYVVYIRASGGH